MNDDLLDLDYTSKCAELFVDEVATKKMKIQLYNVSKDMKLLRVELRVKPSGGLYDIYAEVSFFKILEHIVSSFSY